MENIEKVSTIFNRSMYGFGISPCLLTKTLTKAMNLTTFHNINGKAIYDSMAAFLWWESYIDLLPGVDNKEYNYHIYTDEFIKTTFRDDLKAAKVNNIDCVPIATLRNIIESHVKKWYNINFRIQLTVERIYDIIKEKEEIETYHDLMKYSRKFMRKRN